MLVIQVGDWFYTDQWHHVYHQCDADHDVVSTVKQYDVLSRPVCGGCLAVMPEATYISLRKKHWFIQRTKVKNAP